MADTSLFSRLRRLFSNDVIIRNVGGKQLKIMDSGQIQKYGNLATNSLYDRFTRLHKPVGSSLQYNPTLNYQSMRLQLYSDYEAMDHDPIIAAALDIISDETTIRNQYGDVLNINSSDENVRRVLNNLFYDVLNIEFNLATWVRNMCKYGDFYLKLEVSEKFGVYNVIPMSTYEVVREEGTDPENPSYTRFTLDPNGLASGATNTIRRDQYTLENYEVAHFREISIKKSSHPWLNNTCKMLVSVPKKAWPSEAKYCYPWMLPIYLGSIFSYFYTSFNPYLWRSQR